MRHTACFLSLLGVLLSSQGGLVVHTLFQIRQDHIVRHLCENRSEPDSHCKGMCFLKKRLAEQEQKGEQHTSTLVLSSVFFLPSEGVLDLRCSEARRVYPDALAGAPSKGYQRAIDPPPRAA